MDEGERRNSMALIFPLVGKLGGLKKGDGRKSLVVTQEALGPLR